MPAPNASYSITMRVQLDADPGGIGRLTTAIEEAGGTVTAVDVVESHPDRLLVDLTCNARDADHAEQLAKAVDHLDGVETRKVSDRNLTFLGSTALHLTRRLWLSEQPPARPLSMPSRDPYHGDHYEPSRTRPLHRASRADAW